MSDPTRLQHQATLRQQLQQLQDAGDLLDEERDRLEQETLAFKTRVENQLFGVCPPGGTWEDQAQLPENKAVFDRWSVLLLDRGNNTVARISNWNERRAVETALSRSVAGIDGEDALAASVTPPK